MGLTIDADGCPVVVWGGTPSGLHTARKSVGGWESITMSDTLQPTSRCVAVSDELGNIHSVWDSRGTQYTTKPDVYYACIRWEK
jgi:hypothetical protein